MPRPPSQSPQFSSVSDVGKRLSAAGYLPDAQIATTVFLADRLGKPLLVEGPAGVGKTELPLPPIVYGLIAFGLLLILLAITVSVGKGRPHS